MPGAGAAADPEVEAVLDDGFERNDWDATMPEDVDCRDGREEDDTGGVVV